MRENGMSSPLNGLQILTWFLFPYFLIGYICLVFLPLLPNLSYNLPLGIAILLTALTAVYNGYRACTLNPIDPLLKENLEAVPQIRSVGGAGKKFCWVCQVHVSDNSQHCRFCDKCVHEFDHHCAWLNTCVGSKNYKQFFKCVTLVFTFTFLELVGFTILIVRWFIEGTDSSIRSEVKSLYGGTDGLTFITITIVYYVILFVTVTMIAQLFFFHVNLKRLGISTYDYIIKEARENQKRQRERAEKGKKMREEKKLRIEAGQTLVCEPCAGGMWFGGSQIAVSLGDPSKMSSVRQEDSENDEEDHVDSNKGGEEEETLEMAAITVKEKETGL
ncbi:hypothetical protein TrLO_g7594 [Triparma laevis f. longispina]|uniref:Palmitoyltransferase n=1 Tax=Triparma laevis f. longispina TaxID=1714387 RepID=A0A9W7F9A4_9STRA|nr:hypothetical protein TrLO_g7594 [Triparma laevis f. longispina]